MFEVAGTLGSPLALDEANKKRTFSHFTNLN
jgi:hypothetical protein